MKDKIIELLEQVLHPETELGLISSGFVDGVEVGDERIFVSLCFAKARDPFAVKIKNQVEHLLVESFPAMQGKISIMIKEAAPQKKPKREAPSATSGVANVIAISSAKGGVGKSTVAANLAITLRDMGFRVGILDADIYGPSQPKMFGCEDYQPEAIVHDGFDFMLPAIAREVKIMSIGFFVSENDALLWRGVMATNALKQLVHQTQWGSLDFLLIDLPPGTGDIHLSLLTELRVTSAVIVSTPQQMAIADVRRGVEMFRHEQVNVPIAGLIENMSWFTPAELPDNRYYIFGHGGAEDFARNNNVPFLGNIPIVQSIMECGDKGESVIEQNEAVAEVYRSITERVIANTLRQ